MNTLGRLMVGTVTLSVAGLAALVTHEEFMPVAKPPVVNDPNTVGYGSTVDKNGKPFPLGYRVTPAQAIDLAVFHIETRVEKKLRTCVKGDVSQKEWDLLVDHAYQYGEHATCTSSVVKNINAGKYQASCDSYLLWKKITLASGEKFDCSTPGNKLCSGVWTRTKYRHDTCTAEIARINSLPLVSFEEPLEEITQEATTPVENKTNLWVFGLLVLGVLAGAAYRFREQIETLVKERVAKWRGQ